MVWQLRECYLLFVMLSHTMFHFRRYLYYMGRVQAIQLEYSDSYQVWNVLLKKILKILQCQKCFFTTKFHFIVEPLVCAIQLCDVWDCNVLHSMNALEYSFISILYPLLCFAVLPHNNNGYFYSSPFLYYELWSMKLFYLLIMLDIVWKFLSVKYLNYFPCWILKQLDPSPPHTTPHNTTQYHTAINDGSKKGPSGLCSRCRSFSILHLLI